MRNITSISELNSIEDCKSALDEIQTLRSKISTRYEILLEALITIKQNPADHIKDLARISIARQKLDEITRDVDDLEKLIINKSDELSSSEILQ